MSATLAALYCYPVKGLRGEALKAVDVGVGEGLPHDRCFALTRAGDAPSVAPFPWRPKQRFAMLMRDADLARLTCRVDFDARTIELGISGQAPCEASFETAAGRALIEAYLNAFLTKRDQTPLRLVEAGRLSFTDVPENCLSLINLQSVEELERHAGMKLHPLRFRANLFIGGTTPWVEFDWVGSEIAVGDVRLRVHARIPRCAATAVDPDTGERDVNVVKTLKTHYGHVDMGVYAEVVRGGRLMVGDPVTGPTQGRTRSRLAHDLRFLRFLARSARIFLGRR